MYPSIISMLACLGCNMSDQSKAMKRGTKELFT